MADERKGGSRRSGAPRASPRKTKRPRRRAGQDESTQQVRIRDKNPLIERKESFFSKDELETVLAEDVPTPQAPTGLPIPAGLLDEDATEIADGPPKAPDSVLVVRRPPERQSPSGEATERNVVAPSRKRAPLAAPVRHRLEIPGTEAAGALAAQVNVQRKAAALPRVQVPLLKPLAGFLAPEIFVELQDVLLGKRDSDSRGTQASSSPKRALERVVHAPEMDRLDLGERVVLLSALGRDPLDLSSMRDAGKLLELTSSRGLEPLRKQVWALFSALESKQRALLTTLAERTVHNRSALEDRDLENQSLVDHLVAISQSAVAPQLERRGLRKRDAVTILLSTLARPARIALEEAADGVLGAIEFGLADASPAECARLWRGLMAPPCGVSLPDGHTIDLAAHLAKHDLQFGGASTPFRAALEILAGIARPRRGATRSTFMMPGGHGIDADVIGQALGQLYGVPYGVAAGPAAATRALDWSSEHYQRVPPVFLSVLYEGGERLFVFDHADDERIYFRAPHGASSKAKGAFRKRPERRVDVPELGLESIERDRFAQEIGVVLSPHT